MSKFAASNSAGWLRRPARPRAAALMILSMGLTVPASLLSSLLSKNAPPSRRSKSLSAVSQIPARRFAIRKPVPLDHVILRDIESVVTLCSRTVTRGTGEFLTAVLTTASYSPTIAATRNSVVGKVRLLAQVSMIVQMCPRVADPTSSILHVW
jgi:hypothetical protein